ncbi:MAG: FHA domain-containing serine/threonine-protein kinase [Planctomycetota bacterium]
MTNIEEHEDILLAKLAIAYGLISPKTAVDILNQKKNLLTEGTPISLNDLMIHQNLLTPEQAQKIFDLRDQILLQCSQCKSVYRVAKYKLNTSPNCKRCRVPLPVPENLPALKMEDFKLSFLEYDPATEGIFTILAGTHVGETFPIELGDVFTIGRAEEMSLQISDGAISRKQCDIHRKLEGYFIRDLESRWGTFVNGEKISEPRQLHFGDLLKVGNTVIEFRPKTSEGVLSSSHFVPKMAKENFLETQFLTLPIQGNLGDESELKNIGTMVPELTLGADAIKKTEKTVLSPSSELKKTSGTKKILQKMPSEVGSQLIHGYEIYEKLGAGKMGVVYRALQKETGNIIALKIMKPPEKHHQERIKRFIQEARILCEMDHPNIIKGCDVGVSEPYYFIAMELFDGFPASYFLAQGGPFSERRAALVLLHVSRALAYMEKRNLLHRDIKPSNILINRERTLAKLCDMGLAKMLDHDLSLTKAGCAVGTPFYNSPEVAQGREIDMRSDIYSLGATLYHLVTGNVPYRGETTVDILIKHVREPIPDVAKHAPQISKRLAGVIARMMAKKPEERFVSAEELLGALKPYYQKSEEEASKKSASPVSQILPSSRIIPHSEKQKSSFSQIIPPPENF